MTKKQLETYLSQFPGSESSFPFGPEAMVFKVMGKMFALVSQVSKEPRVTLKCDPEEALFLTKEYESISPGYHMNKKHWVTVVLDSALPHGLLARLAKDSYELVSSKLTKSERTELAINS